MKGTWFWAGSNVVDLTVTSKNTAYNNYFGVIGDGADGQPGFGGYADSNRNGVYDPGQDLYVGTASLSTTVSSTVSASRGTWDASKKTGVAHGYINSKRVGTADGAGFWFAVGAQQQQTARPGPPVATPPAGKPSLSGGIQSDVVTGVWMIGDGNGVVLDVRTGTTPYRRYFGVIGEGSGFEGYADSNNNGSYDPGSDAYVGSASLQTTASALSASSGTWDANTKTGAAKGYIGGRHVGTANGAGFWFLSSGSLQSSGSVVSSVSSSAAKRVGDVVTGRWDTQDGLLMNLIVESGNATYTRYFAVADAFNGRHPTSYRGYGDSNANGQYDVERDPYVGTISIPSWNGTPYFSGTFKASNGVFESSAGADVALLPLTAGFFA